MQTPSQVEKKTNWSQVYSLLVLNAAIVISWIAYHNYQPKLLILFHFEQLSLFLVVAQALILILIPGTAGLIGDYMIKKNGNYFVVFTVGISVTAMVFMCIAFTIGTSTSINLSSALPFMIVIWLISMNIFHSPANSMLEIFAPAKELPSAMALMVLTTELLYALEPWVVDFVDSIGATYTFALGAVLLIASGYFFRKTTRNVTLSRETEEAHAEKSSYINVFAAGLGLGLAVAIINNFVPLWMLSKKGIETISNSQSLYVSLILFVAALAAWPLSTQVNKMGVVKSLRIGLAGAFVCFALIYALPTYVALVVCVLAGLFFSFASVAAFPYALLNLSPKNVTLGAGLFFGSVELAQGLISIAENL
jgi:uncharacterized membrane protein YidH (DUF202 family)